MLYTYYYHYYYISYRIQREYISYIASARVNDCEQTNFDDFTQSWPRVYFAAYTDQRENSFGLKLSLQKVSLTRGPVRSSSSLDRVHNSHTIIIRNIIICDNIL